jgi:hypothetical protein
MDGITASYQPVEIPVQIDFEQHFRMVGRPTISKRPDMQKAQRLQIKGVNEDINHPNGVIGGDQVVPTQILALLPRYADDVSHMPRF